MRPRDTFSPVAIDSSEVIYVKRYLAPIGWALGMLVLILDGKTALAGGADGVALCIRTLIPSLFPFFLLSAMLTGTLSGRALLLTGILGGYPVGAGNAAQAFESGSISRREAERLAVLCNCAGPSFLFGVAGPILGSARAALVLWIVYLLSVAALWAILPAGRIPAGKVRPIRLQEAMNQSIRSMACVCGWVILFRVILAILDRWVLWLLPEVGRVLVHGLLEFSNGCLALEGVDPPVRFVLASIMAGFGGLCVFLQTAGTARGLSLRLYFPGKLFQAAVCGLLASFLVPGAISTGIRAVLALTGLLWGIILRKSENKCGNRPAVIV